MFCCRSVWSGVVILDKFGMNLVIYCMMFKMCLIFDMFFGVGMFIIVCIFLGFILILLFVIKCLIYFILGIWNFILFLFNLKFISWYFCSICCIWELCLVMVFFYIRMLFIMYFMFFMFENIFWICLENIFGVEFILNGKCKYLYWLNGVLNVNSFELGLLSLMC